MGPLEKHNTWSKEVENMRSWRPMVASDLRLHLGAALPSPRPTPAPAAPPAPDAWAPSCREPPPQSPNPRPSPRALVPAAPRPPSGAPSYAGAASPPLTRAVARRPEADRPLTGATGISRYSLCEQSAKRS